MLRNVVLVLAVMWARICEASCFISSTDAIKDTLQNQWSIQLSEQQTDVQIGLLQQAVGAFDTQLTSSFTRLYQFDLQSPLGDPSERIGKQTDTNLRLQKLSRTGRVYTLDYINSNTVNHFTIPREPPRLDTTRLALTVNQPLLRNLLYSPQATLEKTQFVSYEVALYQNVQNVANAIANTLTTYWQVVGNKKIMTALIKQEEMLERFAQYAQELVDENQQGAASLYQPLANLANITVARLQAEQSVRDAYNALMFAMGRTPPCEEENAYACVDFEDFPPLDYIKMLDECCFNSYLELIPEQRMDIVAAYLQEDVAALNLQSALNSTLPELNLVARYGLFNANAGRERSALYDSFPDQHKRQKDVTVGVTLSYPFCNNIAKGLVKQTRAQLFQAQIGTTQLESQIITAFKVSFTTNNALIQELEKARIATLESRAALDVEFIKLQKGLSSWFDVLGLANDAIESEINQYNIEILYLQNLIQLHLLVGDLVCWDGLSGCMNIADFKRFLCQADAPVEEGITEFINLRGFKNGRYHRAAKNRTTNPFQETSPS